MKLDISEFEAFIQRRIEVYNRVHEKCTVKGEREKAYICYQIAGGLEDVLADFRREYKRPAGTVVDDKWLNQVQEEISSLLRGDTPPDGDLNVGKDLNSTSFGIATMYALPLLVGLQKELCNLIQEGASVQATEAALDDVVADHLSNKHTAFLALESAGWKRYQGDGGLFYVKAGQEYFLHIKQGSSVVSPGPAQVYVSRNSGVFIRDQKSGGGES